jgi:RNA polymerase sigma-70 factor, ECF subfamily
MLPDSEQVTTLLTEWREGKQHARDRLVEVIYDELHALARLYLRGERAGHTLQATALVNELYVRLFGSERVSWQNRAHLFAIAAQTLRRILVDYARSRAAGKRGSDQVPISLESLGEFGNGVTYDNLLTINKALDALQQVQPRAALVVELRFFAGLQEPEIAEVLGVSVTTVAREWKFARAWLLAQFLPASSCPKNP